MSFAAPPPWWGGVSLQPGLGGRGRVTRACDPQGPLGYLGERQWPLQGPLQLTHWFSHTFHSTATHLNITAQIHKLAFVTHTLTSINMCAHAHTNMHFHMHTHTEVHILHVY